jgi:two-component system copper resistance phosphate regulon response regulator CusR
MKVLLIEDDRRLLAATAALLAKAGYGVDQAASVQAAEEHVSINQYDCIVLDLNLPDGTGLALCHQLRSRGNITPIIIVTARDGLEDRLQGLELGADDYLMKPVDGRELVARIKALIRRSSKEPLPILVVADLSVDTQAQLVVRAGRLVTLPSKEFAILEYLARHSHQVVTRTMLMEHVWGSEFESFSNVIDVYIRNLRRKVDIPGSVPLIHTVRGSGYVLSDQRRGSVKKPNKV